MSVSGISKEEKRDRAPLSKSASTIYLNNIKFETTKCQKIIRSEPANNSRQRNITLLQYSIHYYTTLHYRVIRGRILNTTNSAVYFAGLALGTALGLHHVKMQRIINVFQQTFSFSPLDDSLVLTARTPEAGNYENCSIQQISEPPIRSWQTIVIINQGSVSHYLKTNNKLIRAI